MAGHAIRARQWAMLLQLLFANALPGAQVQLTAGDAGTQGTASSSANGSYLVEMSQSSWLVAGMLPGIERQPREKLEPNAERLLDLLHRWRDNSSGSSGLPFTVGLAES
jgi:hypothetical protein